MRLPEGIRLAALAKVESIMAARAPDFVIGNPAAPYLRRWWVIPRTFDEGNIYAHEILRSDEDRALHDHPWDNVSLLLSGSYREVRPKGDDPRVSSALAVTRTQGEVIVRAPTDAHRLVVQPGERVVIEGVAEDGTVEAIRISGAKGFALGVQWHAEYDPQQNPINRALFQAFGEAIQAHIRAA